MITDVDADGTGTAKTSAAKPGTGEPGAGEPGAGEPGAGEPGGGGAGTLLPELVIDVTPTFVIAAAIATRDFQDVHHDRDRAVERGGKDIFINILTTTGLVQRYVTDWAGPEVMVRKIAIRLGVPCYAGDKLTFSGRGEWRDQECVVEVIGRCSLGDHVTGTVHIGRAP
jgi:hypothetical protein